MHCISCFSKFWLKPSNKRFPITLKHTIHVGMMYLRSPVCTCSLSVASIHAMKQIQNYSLNITGKFPTNQNLIIKYMLKWCTNNLLYLLFSIYLFIYLPYLFGCWCWTNCFSRRPSRPRTFLIDCDWFVVDIYAIFIPYFQVLRCKKNIFISSSLVSW